MRIYNKQIVTNAVMNTTINSDAYNVDQLYGFAIQAVYTGTPTGTLKLQASCDPVTSFQPGTGTGANPVTNWTDIANSSQAVSAAGNFIWNVTEVMYTNVRLVYSDSSGGTSTAVLNATINAKGI